MDENTLVRILEAAFPRKQESKQPWHRHPVVMMLIGVMVTGLLGGFITSMIGFYQFQNQQRILYEEKLFSERFATAEESLKLVNRYLSDVQILVSQYDTERTEKEWNTEGIQSAKAALTETRKEWVRERDAVQARVQVYFDREAIDRFDTLLMCFRELNPYVINLQGLPNAYRGKALAQIDSVCVDVMKMVIGTRAASDDFRTAMVAELKNKRLYSESFWEYLFRR